MLFRPITIQEANLMLPLLKDRLARIQKLVIEAQNLHAKLQHKKETLSALSASQDGTQSQSEVKKLTKPEQKQWQRLTLVENNIRDYIIEMRLCGGVLKSIFPPQIDFLTKRHTQPVYLNWRSGDRGVSHFYSVGDDPSMRSKIKGNDGFQDAIVH